MSKTIPVSFKDNDRDSKLYEEIKKQGDKSYFVKLCIEFYLKHKDNQFNKRENND